MIRTDSQKRTEIGTVSDEAFARLLILSNFDRWVDIYERSDGKVVGRGAKPKVSSNIPPKYSYIAEKDKKIDGGRNRMMSKCISKFNDEYQKIAADRHRHPHVDKMLMKKFSSDLSERDSTRKVAAIPRSFGLLDPANRKIPAQVIAGLKRKRHDKDNSDDEIKRKDGDEESSSSESDSDCGT